MRAQTGHPSGELPCRTLAWRQQHRLIKFYALDDINQTAADSESGVTIKPVLRMG